MTSLIETELDILGESEALCIVEAEVEYIPADPEVGWFRATHAATIQRIVRKRDGQIVPLSSLPRAIVEHLEERFCLEADEARSNHL